MGNHEFCTDCGESSYHYGGPCDPKVKAAYQRKQKKLERDILSAKRDMKRMAVLIKKIFRVEIDGDGNYIKIHFWQAQKWAKRVRKERTK